MIQNFEDVCMIRLAVVGDIGSGKSYVANNLVIQFLMLMLRLLNYIEKAENVIINLKKILPNYITSFPVKKNELSKAIIANQKS